MELDNLASELGRHFLVGDVEQKLGGQLGELLVLDVQDNVPQVVETDEIELLDLEALQVGVEATLDALIELVDAHKVESEAFVAAHGQVVGPQHEYAILEDLGLVLVLEVLPRLDEPLEARLPVPRARRLVRDQYVPDLVGARQIQVQVALGEHELEHAQVSAHRLLVREYVVH